MNTYNIFGLYSLNNSFTLIRTITPTESLSNVTVCSEETQACNTGINNNENIKNWYEKIEIVHNGRNLEPETTTLEAGKNYEIIINPISNWKWCMSTLITKFDNKVYRILKDQPIIYKVDNIQPWTYEFVCSAMGMHQGTIIVE